MQGFIPSWMLIMLHTVSNITIGLNYCCSLEFSCMLLLHSMSVGIIYSINLLSISFTLVGLLLLKLLLPGRVYKSWPLDTLETSFIFNLALLSLGRNYIREAGGHQNVLTNTYTSTSIAFITFLAILL